MNQKLPPSSLEISSSGLPAPNPEDCGISKITLAFSSLESVVWSSVKSSYNNWISEKQEKLNAYRMQASLPTGDTGAETVVLHRIRQS